MIPKSNTKLTPGDFCYIPRDDGKFAVFVWLCAQGTSRSYFYGALVNVVLDEPSVEGLPSRVDVGDHALIHIKAFRENRTPIAGNMANRLAKGLFEKVQNEVNDQSVGAVHKVWGHLTIVKRANQISA